VLNKKQQQHPEITTLLQEYEVIFQEPQHLTPKRSVDHAITLIEPSKTVNQRPYRLPHHQKNAMEDLIKSMLDSNMIRPSIALTHPLSFCSRKRMVPGECVLIIDQSIQTQLRTSIPFPS
jgi:hypothetical protein